MYRTIRRPDGSVRPVPGFGPGKWSTSRGSGGDSPRSAT